MAKIADQKRATLAQIVLVPLIAQKPWGVPIPGSRKLERLEEHIGAIAVELTADDPGKIERALSEITIQGDRYPKDIERQSGR